MWMIKIWMVVKANKSASFVRLGIMQLQLRPSMPLPLHHTYVTTTAIRPPTPPKKCMKRISFHLYHCVFKPVSHFRRLNYRSYTVHADILTNTFYFQEQSWRWPEFLIAVNEATMFIRSHGKQQSVKNFTGKGSQLTWKIDTQPWKSAQAMASNTEAAIKKINVPYYASHVMRM